MARVGDKTRKLIAILLMLGVALVNIKGIFTDLDVDCEYAIAMSYRMARGDRMFLQMWEPHQTSAFLNAILIRIFLWLTGSTTGIVLYLNAIGVLAKSTVAFFYYRTFKKHLEPEVLFFSCLFFLTVSAKDYLILDFSNMQIYFSMFLFCSLFRYLQDQSKMRWLVGGAIFLCLETISYPTCALTFLVVIAVLWHWAERKGRDICIFSVSCATAFVMYILYFCIRIGTEDFFNCIKMIMTGDYSHTITWNTRFQLYKRDLGQVLILFLICGTVSFVTVRLHRALLHSKMKQQNRTERYLPYVLVFCCLLFLENVISVIAMWESFKLYVAVYYVIFAVAVILCKRCDQKQQQIFCLGAAISGSSCLAVLLLTNLGPLLTTGYFILGIMVSFIPIKNAFQEENAVRENVYTYGVICAFLCATLFRNGFGMFSMSLGGGLCSNILHIGGVVKEGPAIGIVSDYMGPYIMRHNYAEWKQHIRPGDRILIVSDSSNPLCYLYEDTVISVDSTICTPTYNEKILEYWERNPDRFPNIVIVECWYGELKLAEESWIMQWVEEHFDIYEDGTFLRFYTQS